MGPCCAWQWSLRGRWRVLVSPPRIFPPSPVCLPCGGRAWTRSLPCCTWPWLAPCGLLLPPVLLPTSMRRSPGLLMLPWLPACRRDSWLAVWCQTRPSRAFLAAFAWRRSSWKCCLMALASGWPQSLIGWIPPHALHPPVFSRWGFSPSDMGLRGREPGPGTAISADSSSCAELRLTGGHLRFRKSAEWQYTFRRCDYRF